MRVLQKDIVALLGLFGPRVPDRETHATILAVALDERKWSSGHEISDLLRSRIYALDRRSDTARGRQYHFEAMCARCLYNESGPCDPFDYDTAHEITRSALSLARLIGIKDEAVINVIAPRD
jgi:hypothetical protein